MAFVGSGTVPMAADFKASYDLDAVVLVDPKRETYQAAALKRSVRNTFTLGAARYAWRAFREGHRQGSTQGDPWQQGGALVVRPDGSVPFLQRSEHPGDHADPEAILAALG